MVGLLAAATAQVLLPRLTFAHPSVWLFVLGVVALPASDAPIRFRTAKGEDHSFTLEEAVLPGLLLVGPIAWTPAVMSVGVLMMMLRRRADPLKVAYNVAVAALGSLAAVAVALGVAGPRLGTDMRAVTAVVLALLAHEVVTIVSLAGLFFAIERRPPVALVREHLSQTVMTTGVVLVTGVMLGITVAVQPPLSVLGLAAVVMMRAGLRQHGEALSAQTQATHLHEVTAALANLDTAGDPSLDAALRAMAEAFEVDVVQLAFGPRDASGVRVSYVRSGRDVDMSPALDTVRVDGKPLVLLGSYRQPDLARMVGFPDGLVVPFESDGVPGAVAVFLREGATPDWGERDIALLQVLAEHLAVAMANRTLFQAVQDERTALAGETRKLTDILNAADDGIALLDEDGIVLTWNPGIERLTGITAAAIRGRRFADLVDLRDADGSALPNGPSQLKAAQAGAAASDIDLQVRRGDAWRWTRCSFAPVRRGADVSGVVIVARDISRTRDLEILKGDFVAVMSHELRTPLTPLRGYLKMLAADPTALPAEQLAIAMSSMERNAARLDELVNDLQTVSDIDAAVINLSPSPVPLGQIAEAAVQIEVTSVHSDRVRIEVSDQPTAITDDGACLRIVRALVDNAITHGEGGVLVRVHRDGADVVIEVTDHGPGIPSWELDTIFEPFRRLGGHMDWETQGSGLGLTIARGLALRLGGRIEVTSTVGEGSTFSLRLPAPVTF